MPNEDKTLWLTCNGEIYNYRELRRDLIKKGHRFRSETDTEVILHLYEEKGTDAISDLNGMFAFSLWDAKRMRLILARDRFGVKPLYYTVMGQTLAFASEVKAFLALPEFRVRPDVHALAEHFTFQNTFGERTFFEGVKLLPAGHYLVSEQGAVQTQEYWDLRFHPETGTSLEEWAKGLRDRFRDACIRQRVSDVPLGSYLSGGMDTGAISSVVAGEIPGMHTFTCGFELSPEMSALEQSFDESQESHALARLLKTVHHEIRLGPDAMPAVFPQVIWHLDEPRVGISYQVYYTAKMIRQYVKVVLSGVGGDELFGGYPWRYEPVLGLRENEFEKEYYHHWVRLLSDHEKRELFTDEVKHALGDFSTFDPFRAVLQKAEGDCLDKALYFDFKTFLNGLLIVDDKLSMAHSVEARVPFLDNEIINYVARIPSEYKLKAGESKRVFKEAMKGLIPPETLTRRKQGFTPPDATWYRGANRKYVEEMILGKRAAQRGYFEPRSVRTILDQHLSGKKNNRFLLWSLMSFEWWNRLFVDRDSLPQVLEENLQEIAS